MGHTVYICGCKRRNNYTHDRYPDYDCPRHEASDGIARPATADAEEDSPPRGTRESPQPARRTNTYDPIRNSRSPERESRRRRASPQREHGDDRHGYRERSPSPRAARPTSPPYDLVHGEVHSKTLAHGKGPYSGWTEKQKESHRGSARRTKERQKQRDLAAKSKKTTEYLNEYIERNRKGPGGGDDGGAGAGMHVR